MSFSGRSRLSGMVPLPPTRIDTSLDGSLMSNGVLDNSGLHSSGIDAGDGAESPLDTSMMSVSDLHSIGFDGGSVDWGAEGARGGQAPAHTKPREDSEDPLLALLPAPLARAVALLVQHMGRGSEEELRAADLSAKAGQGPAPPHPRQSRAAAAGEYRELIASCRRMFVLALRRDALSRAAAQKLFIASIPASISRGEVSGVMSELRKHQRHPQELRALRASFIAAVPWVKIPPLSQVEEALHKDNGHGIRVAADALLEHISTCAKREGTPQAELAELYRCLTQLWGVVASHRASTPDVEIPARCERAGGDTMLKLETALADTGAAESVYGAAAADGPLGSVMSALAFMAGLRAELLSRPLIETATRHGLGTQEDSKEMCNMCDTIMKRETWLTIHGVGLKTAGTLVCASSVLWGEICAGRVPAGSGDEEMAEFYLLALGSCLGERLRQHSTGWSNGILPDGLVGVPSRTACTPNPGRALAELKASPAHSVCVWWRAGCVVECEHAMGAVGRDLMEALGRDTFEAPPGTASGAYVGKAAGFGLQLLLFATETVANALKSPMGGALCGMACTRAATLLGLLANFFQMQMGLYPRSRSLKGICFLYSDCLRVRGAASELRGSIKALAPVAPELDTGLRLVVVVDDALVQLAKDTEAFVANKIVEAGEPIIAMKSAGDWSSASVADAPSEYMQKLVMDLLSPAAETMLLGTEATSATVLPRVVDGILEALLAHLLKIKARMSLRGAKQLKQDVDFLQNWIQTTETIHVNRRAQLLGLPVFVKVDHVLALLLSSRLEADAAQKSPLPEAQQWIARRVRRKRLLFCL